MQKYATNVDKGSPYKASVVIAEEGMGIGRKQFNLHIITVDNHPYSMCTRKQAPSKNRDGGCHLGKSAVVLLKNKPEEICVRFDCIPNSMQE
jgi:hypothetical protein